MPAGGAGCPGTALPSQGQMSEGPTIAFPLPTCDVPRPSESTALVMRAPAYTDVRLRGRGQEDASYETPPRPDVPPPPASSQHSWTWGSRAGRRTAPAAAPRWPPGRGAARREPSWEHGALSRRLTQVLRHDPVVALRADGAAPLDDVIQALRREDVRWTDLDVKTVEEVVRLSFRDGCPRFELLDNATGQRMIRATGKHTFQTPAIEWQEDPQRPPPPHTGRHTFKAIDWQEDPRRPPPPPPSPKPLPLPWHCLSVPPPKDEPTEGAEPVSREGPAGQPPYQHGVAIEAFDGAQYGPPHSSDLYLTFSAKDRLMRWPKRQEMGWVWGVLEATGDAGWFPDHCFELV